MVASSANKEQIFIGIDDGGTKCRATVFSSQNGVLGTGLGGPANPLHAQTARLNPLWFQLS